jgi:uncharacterized protein YjbI with pentapeptide repeats
MATLACENEKEAIDLTAIAPQNLSGMDFSWKAACCLDFSGKDMRNVLLTGAQISESNFTNADLRGADLSGAWAYDAIFDGADLRGAKLDRLCFRGSSWKSAILDPRWQEVLILFEERLKPGQDLQGLNLSGLCLHNYDLQNANLKHANLENTRLSYTNFVGANLKDAIVTPEELAQATLCRTTLPDGQISDEDCGRLPASPSP